MFEFNGEFVRRLLSVVDKGLSYGMGRPRPGQMCVEAAVCFTMGLPHGDQPTCVHPRLRSFKIGLNDCRWTTRAARANGLRGLAVLQLGTDTDFDANAFGEALLDKTIIEFGLPLLRDKGLDDVAKGLATKLAQVRPRVRPGEYLREAERAIKGWSTKSEGQRSAIRQVRNMVKDRSFSYGESRALSFVQAVAVGKGKDDKLTRFARLAEQTLMDMGVPGAKYYSIL